MKTATIEIEDKVDELLCVLDSDIAYMQSSLVRLDELRGFVIKRDDSGLSNLLANIQTELSAYAGNESQRQLVRKQLADFFGYDAGQFTLSMLEGLVSDEKRHQVSKKKAELVELVGKLKVEHLSTATLLGECSRFNSMLLKGVFGLDGPGTVTYNSRGSAKKPSEIAFMDMQL